MRLLILLAKDSKQNFLIKLHTEELVKEIKELINKRNHSKAIKVALSKGKLEKRIAKREIGNIDADAVLTKDKVIWNLK